MTKIKICGLQTLRDIDAVNRFRPDYAGFVFAPGPRRLTRDAAAELKARLDPAIPSVGVFVNEAPETAAALCRDGIIDLIQLHGDEDEAYLAKLRALTSVPVIKAVRVRSRAEIEAARSFPADFLLLDAAYKDKYGGGGRSFDWSLIPPDLPPFFLAGGLREDNLRRAAEACAPWCADVSSGAETDGAKDPEKIRRLIEIIRRGDSESGPAPKGA